MRTLLLELRREVNLRRKRQLDFWLGFLDAAIDSGLEIEFGPVDFGPEEDILPLKTKVLRETTEELKEEERQRQLNRDNIHLDPERNQ